MKRELVLQLILLGLALLFLLLAVFLQQRVTEVEDDSLMMLFGDVESLSAPAPGEAVPEPPPPTPVPRPETGF